MEMPKVVKQTGFVTEPEAAADKDEAAPGTAGMECAHCGLFLRVFSLDHFPVEKDGLIRPLLSLSERQKQILFFLAEGRSNKWIARELKISEGTVKTHMANLFQRLNVRNRTQAAMVLARGRLPE